MASTTRTSQRWRPGAVAAIAIGVTVLLVVAVLPRLNGADQEGLTAVDQLAVGDCFVYPADDNLNPERVETTSCEQIHFAEVYATTGAGDTESCVGLFESYAGVENYWATDYIIGFIDVDASRMHCYIYAASDFSGSVAG